jgi:DNA repair protein RecO (recombination protein O)
MALSKNFEGVVLKNNNYKDSDKIYTIFVRDLGKISAIAKGVRKNTSKRKSLLDTLNYVKFGLVGNNEIKVLTEVNLIHGFKNIKSNFSKLKIAFYFIEILNKHFQESQDYNDVLDLLLKCLKRLEETSYTDSRIENFFEFQILSLSGYYLNLNECLNCGVSILDSNKFTFNYEKGGLLCDKCSDNHNYLPLKSLESFKFLYSKEFSDDLSFNELNEILKYFISEYLSPNLKTYDYFKN